MFKVMAIWNNGNEEEIDSADSEDDAEHLVDRYRQTHGIEAVDIWSEEEEE